jgi:hypothetical protein
MLCGEEMGFPLKIDHRARQIQSITYNDPATTTITIILDLRFTL